MGRAITRMTIMSVLPLSNLNLTINKPECDMCGMLPAV